MSENLKLNYKSHESDNNILINQCVDKSEDSIDLRLLKIFIGCKCIVVVFIVEGGMIPVQYRIF